MKLRRALKPSSARQFPAKPESCAPNQVIQLDERAVAQQNEDNPTHENYNVVLWVLPPL